MMDEFFNNLTIRILGDDESPIAEDLVDKCVFFNSASPFQLDRVVGCAEPELKKDASIGELWRDVKSINGEFEFNLAAQLPYYLPQFAEAPDYCVRIGNAELFVSTRMVRCFYDADDSSSKLNYYLIHRRGLQSLVEKTGLRQIHPIPIGTLVSKRIPVRARSAETAIQENFYRWVDEMADETSRLLEAIRAVNPERCKYLPPVVTANSFPACFLVVTGADDKRGFDQFAPHTDQFGFRSLTVLERGDLQLAQDYLKSEQPIPVQDYAISLARTLLHQGYRELALVQICVACESVLARQYRDFLFARGVSTKKYKDSVRDVTFSNLLNLHLPTMIDISKWEDHINITTQLNWVRKRRNEIVHEGRTEPVTAAQTEAAINAACKLVEFICART